jgi:hypothetical protein
LPAHIGGVASLLVTALLDPVTLGHALAAEVSNVRLDGTVVLALAFVRHRYVSAPGLAFIAVRATVNPAHGRIVLRTSATFAYTLVQRASQDPYPADPAHRAVVIVIAEALPRNALTCLADVTGRTIAVVVALAGLHEVLQTLHELVRRSEPALSVRLPFASRLLVALVHGTPLAGARDINAIFDAELITAPCPDAAFPRRFFAVPLMTNAYAGTCGLAGVDVVASIPAADRLEHAGTITTSGARNAPVGLRV